jgi:very-short-patch-repair endonuclease
VRPRLAGVTVHQLIVAPVDRTVVDAIPVTTLARTLLDLAAVCEPEHLEEVLDEALRRGLVSISRLRWRLEQLGRRPGSTSMRRLLAARSDGEATPQSVLETRFLRSIRRAKLPIPERQHRIRDNGRVMATVDFAYPQALIAIEIDGYRSHSGKTAWQRDLARRNAVAKLGWRVLHLTAEDLERRRDAVAETIAGQLKLERPPR